MKKALLIALLTSFVSLPVASPAHAVITFEQLDQNTFTVSHKVKGIGSRGKATKLVHTKAASLCRAAGYSFYEILGNHSTSAGYYQKANATLTVRLHHEDGPNRIACEPGADAEYVNEARAKLRRQGYEPPDPTEVPASSEAEPAPVSACPDECTIEQIAAMARAGLTDERIRAACGADGTEDAG